MQVTLSESDKCTTAPKRIATKFAMYPLTEGPMMLDGVESPGSAWVPPQSIPAMVANRVRERIQIDAWIATVMLADISGTIILSLSVFGAYAEPLHYGRTSLWGGVAAFVLIWCLACHSQDLYGTRTMFGGRRVLLVKTVVSWAVTFGLILLLAFSFRSIPDISRIWLLVWATTALTWVILVRILFRHQLAQELRRGHCVYRALILTGSLGAGQRVAVALQRESRGHIHAAAITLIPGLPGAPSCEEIETAIRDTSIDHVFIVDYNGAQTEANTLLDRLINLAVDASLLPDLHVLRAPMLRFSQIGTLPTVDVVAKPLPPSQAVLKRIEDVVLTTVLIVVTLPIQLLIAIAIKLDSPGPVFFRQTRLGFHDKPFLLWKFRTMYHVAPNGGTLRQTERNDSRITRVGRLLRRTSLDELPQLFNVLRGEMSIVGPRPHATTMTTAGRPLQAILVGYESRHRVKPGITGWAQINGCRGEVTTEAKLRRRVELDCYYIEHWSPALDLWIILRTAAVFAFDRNAY